MPESAKKSSFFQKKKQEVAKSQLGPELLQKGGDPTEFFPQKKLQPQKTQFNPELVGKNFDPTEFFLHKLIGPLSVWFHVAEFLAQINWYKIAQV